MRGWIGALWLVCGGCMVGGGDQTWDFQGATSLFVSLSDGDVDVWPSTTDYTTVHYDGGGIGKAANPDVAQDSNGAVSVEAKGGVGGGDIDAQVIGGIPITVLVDRGDISIELAAAADVDACVGAGSVSIGLPPGSYDLELGGGVGSIDSEIVDDPGADFQVTGCMGAGDVDVHVYQPMTATTPE